jgi:hypothetical protein
MAFSSTNLRQFVSAVKTEVELAGLNQFKIFKKTVAKRALTAVVNRTPVDTGRLKGNWLVGINNTPAFVDENFFDREGSASIAAGTVTIDSSVGLFDDIFIINSIHYLQYVHDGTEKHAGNPFVLGVAEELGLEFVRL